MKFPLNPSIRSLLEMSLKEDIGKRDLTTEALVPRHTCGGAFITAKAPGVLAGLPLVKRVYAVLDRSVRVSFLKKDGEVVRPGVRIAKIQGSLRSILTGERVALNFLGHLSGIATLTSRFVAKAEPYGTKIMDTRKTLPSYRALQKYAVRCGGGANHRMSLYEAVMVKDNHLGAIGYDWDKLHRSLRKIRPRPVIVEVDRLSFLPKVISLHPRVILLDNMSVRQLKKAVRLVRKSGNRILLEASGRVDLKRVRDLAKAGVDRISVGALTHSAPHLDFSLEVVSKCPYDVRPVG